jgi:molybdenum-dependent DNA-binding transcriptional regulator ModE
MLQQACGHETVWRNGRRWRELTPLGRQVVEHYRVIERKAKRVTATHLTALQSARKKRR